MSKFFAAIANNICIALLVLAATLAHVGHAQHQHILDTLHLEELYAHTDQSAPIEFLRNGDSEFASLQLEQPLNFYSDRYDQIFINTNGILTFNIEFAEYINQPFPLEYPSIAAFYSNVDTSGADSQSTSISLFASNSSEQLQKASDLVRYAFHDKSEFEARSLIVATWQNVGYFESKTDKLNTFQAALIFNEHETFVQLIYPDGGLNWLQGETGPLGLPDIRAQAGFVAEDGRFYNLEGSASDNARFLSESSNIGVPGVWLYQVGPIERQDNVHRPDNVEIDTEPPQDQQSCATESHKLCHSHAECTDKSAGFCCVCLEGFYGNGRSCIRNDQPIRVTGSVRGDVNGLPLDERSKLQSYVVMNDARSYTAVNPVSAELGSLLRLALPIVSTIGWLFAKPSNGALNGYHLTGGEFVHTSRLFFDSGERLTIKQTFEGLNYWDQLAVRVEVHGEVPRVDNALSLHMADYIEEYKFVAPGELRSEFAHTIEVPEENRVINFQLDQSIMFERCLLDEDVDPTGSSVLFKASKVVLDYIGRDQALRTSVLAKIGVDAEANACTDGSASCGDNTVCIPYEDSFRCDCLNGYGPQLDDQEIERCVDIDECQLGTHVCDENASCTNTEGGFSCACYDGFVGSGFRCALNSSSADSYESSTPPENIIDLDRDHEHEKEEERSRDREREREDREREDRERAQREREDREREQREREQWEYEQREREQWERDHRVRDQQERDREAGGDGGDAANAVYPQSNDPDYSHKDECYHCSPDANCVGGRCQCHEGFTGDGYACRPHCGHDEAWENGRCVPILFDDHEIEPTCNFIGDCTCPTGYELTENLQLCRYVAHHYDNDNDFKAEELVPCDVDSNCHINASCEWYEHEMRHICTCNPGFQGDGYSCQPINESCGTNPKICSAHATCNYNEALGKSECQCQRGYEGDGFYCQLAPECQADAHCGQNSFCDAGVCQCVDGFERDVSDACVPAGRCGAVFCGANAICKWDAQQGVQYCDCMEGYEGDAVAGCKSIPTPCNIRNTCGVHATCEPTEDPARYECQCNAGFHGDGYVCTEDQNCLNNPHMCDMNAMCRSTNSGLVCVCNQGFYGNGSVCLERQQHDSGFLLVSQGVVIVRVPLNGRNARPISVASMAIGLDKDCVEGRIYWGDISAKKIISAKYNGTDSRSFITEDIESPEGIAIDSISRRIYWTDSVKDTIEVASLDDANLRAVLVYKNLVNPRGIAIDPYRQKLYWSDWNRESPKIEMSNLDGTGRELLLGKDSVTLPNSLVVLESTGELCYADAGTKKVECIDSYTKQLRTISNELTYPFGLTFTHNQFFWTDWTTKKLESVDTYGNRQMGMQTPFFGSHKMYGMTAIEEHCSQQGSPCQIANGGCTDGRICLANNNAPSGKNCKCTKLSKTCNVSQ